MIHYTDERVTLHHGDCLDVLRELPDNSVDAVVTDPPYGLEFMGREWDAFRAQRDPRTAGRSGAGATGDEGITGTGYTDGANRITRPSFGGKRPTTSRCAGCGVRNQFRNKHAADKPGCDGPWVTEVIDPTAPSPLLPFQHWCEQWATECLRVLKPGGHLLAFGGSRTWHRLAAGIEDAGFEMRDSIAWLYGSGFPKSLDVGKALDKARDDGPDRRAVGAWLRAQREAAGLPQKAVAAHWPSVTGGLTGCVANWEGGFNCPTWEQWQQLREIVGFDDTMDAEVWRLNGRKGTPGEAWDQREVIGRATGAANGSVVGLGLAPSMATEYDVTAPATDLARQWHGWGTALKPAVENLVVAQKPPLLQARIGSHLDALEQACRPLANDAASTSAPTRPASREAMTATAPAHAATPREDEPARPTPTGAADASPAQTATSPFESTATTCSSIVTSWKRCWAALSEPTSTSTTATTSSTTTDLTTLWSCLSKLTGPSTLQDPTSPDGLSPLARAADSLFAAAFLSWSATRTLTATEPATSPTPEHSLAADGSRQEPIVVARKPLAGTVAANVTAWGTGALNIGATRVRMSQEDADFIRKTARPNTAGQEHVGGVMNRPKAPTVNVNDAGRWPTNVVMTHSVSCGTVDQPGPCVEGCPVRELDAQSGTLTSGVLAAHHQRAPKDAGILGAYGSVEGERGYGDTGGASRFFPTTRWDKACSPGSAPHGATDPDDTGTSGSAVTREPAAGQSSAASAASGTSPDLPTFRYEAKAPTIQRPRVKVDGAGEGRVLGKGLSDQVRECRICGNRTIGGGNGREPNCGHGDFAFVPTAARSEHVSHPTVKPLDLMRWLVRLVVPPGGTCLEPFAGSGTTAEACVIEGMHCIAIEREADYLPLIVARLSKPIELDLFGGVA